MNRNFFLPLPLPPFRSFHQTDAGEKVKKLATILQTECDVQPGDRVLLLQDSGCVYI